ncbi:MAG TPA: methyltransferase domain-containing protein [Deltaproteobacteria bacterium]|nr:methyltransferase domain-containing protein [Deltaproteobacteria bacterium]
MSDDIRATVERFYSEAATEPRPGLCCPVSVPREEVAHIPEELFDISYGCGSPVLAAGLAPGMTLLDLGCGAGVDCFIAAKLVGGGGRVIGVDMTDEMLRRAREAAIRICENLGYDVVEFRKGFLEKIPVEDGSVDVVTSNCVINLSPHKDRVMREIYRVLKDSGTFCISDVVAGKEIPPEIRADSRLWGECIAGAVREEEFIETARAAGFYGIKTEGKYLYRRVEGIDFHAVTIRGYKLARGEICVYRGHMAVYNGPFSSVCDDEGHTFPAGRPVEVCTDTAERLRRPPYRDHFTVIEPGETARAAPCKVGDMKTGCC